MAIIGVLYSPQLALRFEALPYLLGMSSVGEITAGSREGLGEVVSDPAQVHDINSRSITQYC